ncbi:hypothetical protein QBC35DRAFT_203831 [Podospora australis]|uniref:VPS9 domain-containing protein n=1 Tax=Podospora australis TaxID=1536484 RepID=A0AAN7AL80_9PEZI|nr:hypothetical protein QBC35DRAFT_203831 [Podospora australis]
MQPLNPFLSAFSKTAFLAQCSPPQQHILLVPTADVLLNSRDTETGAPLVASIASEEFLGSHVLRIPLLKGHVAGGKDAAQNLREMRGKPKMYGTINGRSLVIKDGTIYTNKGYKALAHANLLHDAIWYPDTLEPRQFLIYYISRPLVGSWEEAKIIPAIPPAPSPPVGEGASSRLQKALSEARDSAVSPKKKDIKSFHELLNHFPAIAKQMQNGLEKLFREFTIVFERMLPPPPTVTKNTTGSIVNGSAGSTAKGVSFDTNGPTDPAEDLNGGQEGFPNEDDEEVMRTSLETAVTTAIDLFQSVDKQQLSQLAATTDLTGPVVEKLIERYISENVHHLLFTRLAALRRREDLELEAKIRQMDNIDISQLGIAIDGGARVKRDVVNRLGRAVEEFRKMPNASCPQEMMEILLSTTKTATQFNDPPPLLGQAPRSATEKPAMTVNADTLVSLLLYVVIKAQIKHLQARLTYVRYFIFMDDVDSGEMGYALSTFEAVLSYLDRESGGLRRASRRNKALWDSVSKGDMVELKKILEPSEPSEDAEEEEEEFESFHSHRRSSTGWGFTNGSSRRSSTTLTVSERFSLGSGLGHVFPFQNGASGEASLPTPKRVKRVSMDTRSMSSGSEISFRSMPMSIGTFTSGIEGDTSIERLIQTQNAAGESVLMMSIQHGQVEVLQYLLSLRQYYTSPVLLEDQNNEGTTLFSAAVQLGNVTIINTILDYLLDSTGDDETISLYFARQDTWGRSAAHYLFHAPFLISRIGRLLPWRQKDKNGQTPLFALCRSYDHPNYYTMVEEGLEAATRSQGDGQPLHLDEHIDIKGNSLLHIVNEPNLALKILHRCDVDVNATNEKKFTALMLASKYGRFDMVRTLFGDPRVDVSARELRGLTAVELAKDDDLRNKIDDLVLFSLSPGTDSRTTGVVRSFFVEDGTIRFVLKSGAPVDKHSYAVTTCRRSLTDFEHLAKLLQMENPASWLPSLADLRSPTQIPSRPSRAVLKDLQIRMDWFLRVLLAHPTFATHEMLWEFFLVPDLQLDMMAERSRLKADALLEKVHDEFEPVEDLREVEQFVDHARDIVRSVHFSTRSVARRANNVGNVMNDLFDSSVMLARAVATLPFLPPSHISAFETYVRSLAPSQSSPNSQFFAAFLALYSNIEAILKALARPPQTISKIIAIRREVERNYNTLSKSSRWPLGLLDETRLRNNEEREEKARKMERDAELLGKELRYTQTTVAQELAGWREMHEKMARKAIRDLARGMVIAERGRLEGVMRALRRVREFQGEADSVSVRGRMGMGLAESDMLDGSDDRDGSEEMGESSRSGGGGGVGSASASPSAGGDGTPAVTAGVAR